MSNFRWLAQTVGCGLGRIVTPSGIVLGSTSDLDVDGESQCPCECCCPAESTSYTISFTILQGYESGGGCSIPAFPQTSPQILSYDGEGCGFYVENAGFPPELADFTLSFNYGGYASAVVPSPGYYCGYWNLQAEFAGGGGSSPCFCSWIKTTSGGDASGTYTASSDVVGACTLPSSVVI